MLLLVASAILLILSFPNFNLNLLVYIAFIPLFFAIQNKSPKKAFVISYISGFLFYIGTLYWLSNVTLLGVIILSFYLALYFGIFGWFFVSITLRKLIFLPILWVLLEVLQSYLFTGFGWTLLGYSQYKNLLIIQIADFFKVYGVSFLIMLVNIALYRALKKSFKDIILVGIIMLMVVGYGLVKINEKEEENSVKVSVIQGNIPQEIKWADWASSSILDKYSSLTKASSLDNPDLIVWPETSFPGFLVMDKEFTKEILDLAKEVKIPLLLGTNTIEGVKNFNSAVLISEEGKIVDKYNKLHLVPFGEYVPFEKQFPVLHDLILGKFGSFTRGREFKTFKLKAKDSNLETKFAVLICFEDIFPSLARKFVKEGSEFLIVITNDAWYGETGAPYQYVACSVFRAIENRVPIVRCANTGYSCFIDSRGRIYDSVEKRNSHLFITGYKTSEVLF